MTLSGSDSRWQTPIRTRGDSNPTRNTGGASSVGATALGRGINMMASGIWTAWKERESTLQPKILAPFSFLMAMGPRRQRGPPCISLLSDCVYLQCLFHVSLNTVFILFHKPTREDSTLKSKVPHTGNSMQTNLINSL